jgi:cytochrome c peroxidase
MRSVRLLFPLILTSTALAACGSTPSEATGTASESLFGDGLGPFINAAGLSANLTTAGSIDFNNEFFQSLGTNGRACVTCHTPQDGFSLTPATVQERFERCEREAPLLASGVDNRALSNERIACAIFRTNDGSNSPNADVSTRDARRAAYSMLLTKGLIRIGIGVPENADFDVVAIDDPYGFATPNELSLFRRPLPATDLAFDRSVMWDIRETSTTFIPAPFVISKTLNDQLSTQANNATLRHAQAVASLTPAQLQSIVNFELGLFSAQVVDFGAGFLGSRGASGGVVNLSTEPVPPNASNVFGLNSFTPIVFTLFDAWAQQQRDGLGASKRASIVRGQVLFNTRRAPGINRPPFFDPTGTNCGECHNSADNGGSTVPVPTGQVRVSAAQFRTPDLPLYTLQCSAAGVAKKACTEGQQDQTTDPGRALITGSWRSLDNFKVPGLRNLAARAPYFHNGSAATLADVVDFYKTSMQFQFTDDEKQDLVNFMSAL